MSTRARQFPPCNLYSPGGPPNARSGELGTAADKAAAIAMF